jgi:hypothetical protein
MPRSLALVLVLALLLALSVVGCTKNEEAPPATQVVDKLGANPAVNKYIAFVTERRADRDFTKLAGLYAGLLQTYVTEADARHGAKLAAAIDGALTAGRAGTDPAVNAQIAEKSIQRAFMLDFFVGLDTLTTNVTDQDAYRRVVRVAPLVKAVAARREAWTGQPGYGSTLDRALANLFDAVNDQNAAGARLAAEQVAAQSEKMILLSVFYELHGLAAARGDDPSHAGEKRVEALLYYQSFYPAHLKRHESGAKTVLEQLSAPVDKIDVDLVRSILRADFTAELLGLDPQLLGA